MKRKPARITASTLIAGAAMLAACWGGPDVTPLVIVTVEPPPAFGPIGPPSGVVMIEQVSQTDLSIFFSQYEDDEDIPPEVLERYLTDPALMAIHNSMITDLIDHVQAGGAPLTPQEFYAQALAYTGDPGTALIVCHNVLKAMARGRSPIAWEKQSEVPLSYVFDGRPVNGGAMPVHPDAATTGSRGQPSLFYRFFSPTALGQFDEGDWYHYFLEEAYYGTDYGGTQQEASREARDHMRGAIFGLSLAGFEAQWPWLVPRIGSASATGVDVSEATYETLDPMSVPEGGSP